ncbi:puromycin-sensitive aminopeptidase-like, partial [Contarinia nasturtii]|uniref:puromycin-sensitive aminopeptidase-like n=1 Tax=Contarinia nasturtii TaxID=265458 RepID=UPI0012D3F14F
MARLLFIVTFTLLCNILNISAVQPFDVTNIGELNSDNVNYRLPNNTIPEVYKVYISTDVANKNFGFSGMVNISVKTLNATNTIIVHQRQLNIVSAELMAEGGQYISIVPPHYDPVTEFLTIKTVNYTLFEGMRVFLSIKYNGTLQQSPSGFYRTSYYDSNGKERWLATTHFEPTYARHAFPCMDEPAMKATFEISIEHNSAYTAISNMPQANQVIMGSRTISHFCKTPLMSTYLIAFVVSNFAFKEQLDHNGLKHRVFVKPTEIENAYFAVNESAKILNAFSDYLQVNYSLPKMDQIAIPQLYFG